MIQTQCDYSSWPGSVGDVTKTEGTKGLSQVFARLGREPQRCC